jgi:hypothetical protein
MYLLIHILFSDVDDEMSEKIQNSEISKESVTAKLIIEPRLDLNVTTSGQKPRVVVYNRVPKCGSQTMSMLINQLSRKNDFLSKAVFVGGEKPERSISG